MNTVTRAAVYSRTRNGGELTPKQHRRLLKKSHAGVDFPVVKVVQPKEVSIKVGKLATPPEEFTAAISQQVRAKVGIITYTGHLRPGVGTTDQWFQYTTKAGVAKVAKKFTVLDD